MKYSILIIICLFFYVYPIFLSFLPIPLDRVLQIVGFGVFLFTSNFRNKLILSVSVQRVLMAAGIIVFSSFIVQGYNYSSLDYYFVKLCFDTFLYFFSSYLIVFLLYRRYKYEITGKVLEYLIIVYVIQALLSFLMFLYPSFFDLYVGIIKQDNNENFMERLALLEKRLIGVGSGFFLGVVKYGVGLFAAIILPFVVNVSSKFKYILSLLLIGLAGVMTGRTFYIAIVLGLVLFLMIEKRNMIKLITKVLPIAVVSFIVVVFMADRVLEADRVENILNYIVEIFVNYEETGSLSTSSSDATLAMYIYPNNLKTWLMGDGRMLMDDGSYYMGSDVGYIRLLFYFGAIFTVLFFVVKLIYSSILIRLTDNRAMKLFFVILFCWTLVLNMKGIAILDQFILIFLLSLVVDKQKHKLSFK